jgi:ribonuclease P protein component
VSGEFEFRSFPVSGVAPNGSSKSSTTGRPLVFPRSARLLRHADFDLVYRTGRRHFAPHLTVFYLLRAENQTMRVGFTVGRPLGGAVDRNRMKRRLREAVRRNWPENKFGVDVVINPKKSMLAMDFAELTKEVAAAFAAIEKFVQKQKNV